MTTECLQTSPRQISLQMAEQPDTMIVADPSLLEEECCKGKMVIGVNAYREVCSQQSIRHTSVIN